MTLRTPKNDPPGTSRGPLRNPPKRGVFGGFSGGFRGVFWGPRRGGFRGSRRAPGAPEKGHFGGGDPGGRAARPPGEDRGGGGATMTTTARPRKPSDRGATFCVARYTNGIDDIRFTSTTPPSRISNETTPDKKNFEHHHDITMTCNDITMTCNEKNFANPPRQKIKSSRHHERHAKRSDEVAHLARRATCRRHHDDMQRITTS